ncbi:cytoskeleton-associated protein 4 [Pungitius pungitius]|uniref:cytoskeleton-associated protein 4 n=1 Tax=Pungitius pungitius TaxID=134920 RepID=UPI002E0E0AAB
MTAKNRHKNSSSEKSVAAVAAAAASSAEDAPRKSPKSTGNGVSGPGAQGSRSGSCLGLGLFVTVLFYVALLGAAGLAAFYLQRAAEEMRESGARHEAAARQSAELSGKMERVVQQVESLGSVVDGLESSLGVTRVELEGAVSRLKRGEVETRRVEEALQRLQNNLLKDLSDGIEEVKEARERDFSLLESTVEERLAEVSRSVAANVAEFAEAQGEARRQLADLEARLADVADPALVKRELSAMADVVAEIKMANDASEGSAESILGQIGAVRSELQTRNQEVASLSQEVESVRAVVQDTVGNLRQSLSATQMDVKDLQDKSEALEGAVQAAAEAAQAQRRSEDLEARVKTSEENGESLSASVSDISTKVESLFAQYDTHESALAAQGRAAEKAQSGVGQDVEALKSILGELQSNMAALGSAQTELSSKDSSLGQQVAALEEKLGALEERGGGVKPEELQSLSSTVASLEAKAAKLEGHEKSISALQKSLQETTKTLEGLSEGKKGK